MGVAGAGRRGRALAVVAGVLVVAGVAAWLALGERAAGPPNVLLITIESLRPDHVGCYTGTRPTTPQLDALAREGMVYEAAHSVTSWTLSSHASLFTGLYPSAHLANRPLGRLEDGHRTLAETLSARGYQCAGVVSGPYLRKPHNLQQGFSWYDETPAGGEMASAHDDVTNQAMLRGLERFLAERDGTRPFFLFAYFWDPHYDYIPPAPYDGMFVEPGFEPTDVLGYEVETTVHPGIRPAQLDFVRSQYDGEIRWTDEHLGRLFEALRAAGLWEDTLVVVTADHGEEFFEHGNKGHKHNLYQESVHVPLVVKYPGDGPRGRDARLVSLVDVLPTVLEVTRCGGVQAHEGRSLLAPPDPARAIFFELRDLWYFSRPGEPEQTAERQWFAVRAGDEKLIVLPAERRLELYDLASDPGETRNVGPEREQRVQELLGRLERWRAAQQELAALLPTQGQAELSEELLQRLRSLGYLR